MKILIVDDSKLSRKWSIQALPDYLFKHSKILEAKDGEEGVELFKSEKPDLVLMDITMPIKNGFEALEDILKIDPNAFVIMVSADRQKITKDKISNIGAKGIIHKPIDEEELRKLLLFFIQKESVCK